MRTKAVPVILVILLLVLVGGVFLRSPTEHVTSVASPTGVEPVTEAGSVSSEAGPNVSAGASTSAGVSAPVPTAPAPFPRQLRIAGLGWDMMSAGILARDGELPREAASLKKQGLDARFGVLDAEGLEAALARGGADERGVDIAILPLPRFVASYEKLKALDPVVFLVVGWIEGRDVILTKQKDFEPAPTATVKLRAKAGSGGAYAAVFGLEMAGVTPDRVSFVGEADAWDVAALSKRESKDAKAHVLFTTAEASRLIPIVAVAQGSFVAKHEATVTAFAQAWFAGQQGVAEDAAGAARRIAKEQGELEPLGILEGLGELGPASLGENTALMGLSGRGAGTLERVFDRIWRSWRGSNLVGVPPERAPLDSRIVAAVVRGGGDLKPPPTKTDKGTKSPTEKPLLVYRAPKGALNEDLLLETAAFLAEAFPRSPVRVTIHRGADVDAKATAVTTARCIERFGLQPGRMAEGKARAKNGAAATVEVLPIP